MENKKIFFNQGQYIEIDENNIHIYDPLNPKIQHSTLKVSKRFIKELSDAKNHRDRCVVLERFGYDTIFN
jgi:hypothetical protein